MSKPTYEELEKRIDELKKADSGRRILEKELKENMEKYRFMFETMINGFALLEMMYDKNGKPLDCRYVEVNPAHEKLTGLESKKIVGRTARECIPGLEDLWIENYGQVDKTGESMQFENYVNGLNSWYGVFVYRPRPGFVAVTFKDITQRKIVEKEKETLSNIIENVINSSNLEELLSSIHQNIRKIMYADNCFIALYDSNAEKITFPLFADEFDSVPLPREKRKGLSEYVLKTGKPLSVDSEQIKKMRKKGEIELIGTPSESWLGVPLLNEQKPFGVLVVQSYDKKHKYTDRDRKLLISIGCQAVIAIERKKAEDERRNLLHDLRERMKELSGMYSLGKLTEQAVDLDVLFVDFIRNIVPPSMQYPDKTFGIIELDGIKYCSLENDDFCEGFCRLTAPIIIKNTHRGSLSIGYTEGLPFIEEYEQKLVNGYAERLGKIIERKEAEKMVADRTRKLFESEKRFQKLLNSVSDVIWYSDKDGRIMYINPAGEKVFGRTVNELKGKSNFLFESVHPEDKDSFKTIEEELIEKSEIEHEYRIIKPDGEVRWLQDKKNIILDSYGNISQIGCITKDITEKKHFELDLETKKFQLQKENIKLKKLFKDHYRFGNIIGKSPLMHEIYKLIVEASSSDANVSIYGESGTGKELAAKAIHENSDRRKKSFVAVNCGAIPETLFESEFFGYKKGAFSGANKDKYGFFDLADNGTLFLDEIGELTLNMQVKLLRAIEGHGYIPVGGTAEKKVNARIITATNRDITKMVKQGMFRQDLFYRIHVIILNLPPLRERREDIPLLIEHFTKNIGKDKKTARIPLKIVNMLTSYDWPGNIRELQNAVQQYLTLKNIDFLNVVLDDRKEDADLPEEEFDLDDFDLNSAKDEFEKRYIVKALKKTKWHKTRTASLLHIDRKSLFRKMKNFGL